MSRNPASAASVVHERYENGKGNLLKRYVEEGDSAAADALLRPDDALLTGRHAVVEVRRTLARLLAGRHLTTARTAFGDDLASIIELDAATCAAAAAIAEATGVRTLDALHLAAAQRIRGAGLGFLTFDVRQAQAGPPPSA